HCAPTEQEGKAGKARFLAQRRVELRQMQGLRRLFDDRGAGELGAVGEPDGDDVVAPIAPLAGVDFKQARAAAFAERNQAACMERARGGSRAEMDDLDRVVELDARRDL